MNTLPCAIYTRKSSEEGLEQDFNSLDAQREACDAFILSQKTQGWKGIGCYDDGGFSGGNVERPGLQRPMGDIRLGKVKVIVVYKVDLERHHVIAVPVRLKQGNDAMRLVVRDRSTEPKTTDSGLVALLARANRWFAAVRSGEHDSIASLAAERHQAGRDITRTMYLAFLAPDIIETIARGEQPVGMGVRRLVAM